MSIGRGSFHAWFMKLSCHQVFIHPQRTPIEWLMPDLLRCSNLSKADFRLHIAQCFCHISLYRSLNSSILDALEPALDETSDFQLFLPWTCLTRSSKLMKTTTSVFEVQWRCAQVCNSFGYDFSHLNIYYALHGLWNLGFLPQFSLLRSLAWPSTKQVQDLQIILQTNTSITTIYYKVSWD
jgi:hypothetical protein